MNERLNGMIANQGAPGPRPWPVTIAQPGKRDAYMTGTVDATSGTAIGATTPLITLWHPRESQRTIRIQSVYYTFAGGAGGLYDLYIQEILVKPSVANLPSSLQMDPRSPPPEAIPILPSAAGVANFFQQYTFAGAEAGWLEISFIKQFGSEGFVLPPGINRGLAVNLQVITALTTAVKVNAQIWWTEGP